MAAGKPFDRQTWEANWVNRLGVSPCTAKRDPAAQASAWVKEAYQQAIAKIGEQGEIIGASESQRKLSGRSY